jgi:hypothetical protein
MDEESLKEVILKRIGLVMLNFSAVPVGRVS